MNIRAFIPVDKAAFHRFIATEPEQRYEFAHGRIIEMHGGTNLHFRIARRMSTLLEAQVDAKTWLVFQEFGVETPQTVRFPDVVVLPVGDPSGARWTQVPAVIVEVLSASTSRLDLDEKPREYMSLPSLQAYIVASQTEAACLAWIRGGDGRFPAEPVELVSAEKITIPALGVAIDMADIYAGLALDTKGPPSHA